MSENKHGEFRFRGGHPALDFINTASERNKDSLTERIGSYDDLLDWSVQAEILDEQRIRRLRAEAGDRPRAARSALLRARELREAAFRLFNALIDADPPEEADLELLNRRARKVAAGGELAWHDGAFVAAAPASGSPLDEPLDEVTRGIVQVLTGEASQYVARCCDCDCAWLFLDRSPARARRWCSMADCGNRAKARRHYKRQKARRG